jgi:hypothetical protein
MTACHEPGNGKPTCIRQDDIDRIDTETRTTRTMLERLERRSTEEFLGVFAAISRVETKIDRLIEGVGIGQIAPIKSIDYDELSDTGVIRASQLLEEENRQLRAQLLAATTAAASATARFEERTRHSDRAHGKSIAKWKLITGLIVTVVTSGTVTALIAQLLKG